MNYKIVKRKVSKDEAVKLVEEIKKTPKISAYSIKEWMKCGNVLVAQNKNGEMFGACLNDDFSRKWTELAALFVFEDFRAQGVGKALFHASLEDMKLRKRNILTMSNNPFVIKMMKKAGLDIIKSLDSLESPYDEHRFVLTHFYETRWMFNFFRIKEVIRKKRVFGKKEKYTYGLRLAL
jgi:GNAT superfamily N-acetyltransferase